MKRKQNFKKNRYEKPIIAVILITILFITVGFSSHQSSLDISDMSAMVRAQKDIRIIEITMSNITSNATSNWEEYSVSSIFSSINLPNKDSTITYNIKIINIGNVEASIFQINGLPNNLTYSISNYNLNEMLCDNEDSTNCKLGSTTTLAITIKYSENGFDSNKTEYLIGMNFIFNYMTDAIAKIENKLYNTLQEAINDVPSNNTETKISLLNNTSEIIVVNNKKT